MRTAVPTEYIGPGTFRTRDGYAMLGRLVEPRRAERSATLDAIASALCERIERLFAMEGEHRSYRRLDRFTFEERREDGRRYLHTPQGSYRTR